MKLSRAHRYALSVLAEGPIPETGLSVLRIQRRVIATLVENGYARWHPYGKPPNWKITALGRAASVNGEPT